MSTTIAQTADDSVLAARRRVIDESGWGDTFRIIQPRNFTFWVGSFLFVVGTVLTLKGFTSAAKAYTQSFGAATVWFGIFTFVFMWLFHHLDRYSSIPAKAKVVAFLFSGLVSTFGMAAINNDAFRSLLAKWFGSEWAVDWGAGVTAPWSEEIAKLLPVILLIGLAPRIMRCAFDGLIVGAIAGLAFQVFEDVAYVYGSAQANFAEAKYGTTTMTMRTVLGVTGHWTWSAVCGAGVIYLVGRSAQKRNVGLGIALILSSMLLHFTWDSISALTGGSKAAVALYLPLTVVNLLVFIWVYRRTVAQERAWANDLLAPEVGLGVLSEEELAAAVGPRKLRKHFVRSQKHHHRSAKHVLEGARDLADELAAGYGVDTEGVLHARAEIARVRAY
jgi:RsiW-degrading membrane proteinase PrsW (M82 family)